MRVNVVRIGNSRGVRLPRAILEQAGTPSQMTVSVEDDGRIVLTPVRHAREGWDELARRMAAEGEDELLDPETPTDFDRQDWTWPDHPTTS